MTGMPPQISPGMMGQDPSQQAPQGPAPAQGMPSPMSGGGMPSPGVDPRNAMMGMPHPRSSVAPQIGDSDHDFGSVPADTHPDIARIIRSMHSAYANKGVNPMDSHPEMAKKWEKSWKDKTNRDAIKAAGGNVKDKNILADDAMRAPDHEAKMKVIQAIHDRLSVIHPQAQAHAALVDRMLNAAKQRVRMSGMSGALPVKR